MQLNILSIRNLKNVLLSIVFLFVSSQSEAQDTNETKNEVETIQTIGDVILFSLPALRQ
jgi:phage head maturation protease